MAREEIVVVPSAPVDVTLARTSPGTATFYAAASGGSAITFPDAISARKSYFVQVDAASAAPQVVDERGGYTITVDDQAAVPFSVGRGSPPVLSATPTETSGAMQSHGNTGATETFSAATAKVHKATLNAACTFTFAGARATAPAEMTLILTQDATGSRLVTWPASVKWAGGVAPTLSTAAGKVDVFRFLSADGGTTWLGSIVGLDMR